MALNTYPYSPFPASTEQIHKGDNEDLQAQIDAIKDGINIDSFGDVETALEDKTDTAVIAPAFDAEAGVYAVGDLVMYQGKLYEFTTAHETTGDWDSTEVTEKTVSDEIDTVKSGLTNLSNESEMDMVELVLDGTDGRFYSYTFNNPFTLNRSMFLVLRGNQLGTTVLSTAIWFSDFRSSARVGSSDTSITSSLSDGKLTLTVDAGSGAWVKPVIYMSRHMFNQLK